LWHIMLPFTSPPQRMETTLENPATSADQHHKRRARPSHWDASCWPQLPVSRSGAKGRDCGQCPADGSSRSYLHASERCGAVHIFPVSATSHGPRIWMRPIGICGCTGDWVDWPQCSRHGLRGFSRSPGSRPPLATGERWNVTGREGPSGITPSAAEEELAYT
jgi:hypothetical protein